MNCDPEEERKVQEKTVKVGEKQYRALTEMLQGARQRAQVIEGLIEILAKGFEEDRYLIFDVMNDPASLMLKRKKDR